MSLVTAFPQFSADAVGVGQSECLLVEPPNPDASLYARIFLWFSLHGLLLHQSLLQVQCALLFAVPRKVGQM